MKKVLLLAALVVVSVSAFASSNPYKIDDSAVEATFSQSEEATTLTSSPQLLNANTTTMFAVDDPDATTAGILALFLGTIGVHRLYMNSPFKVAIIYWVTCGGVFGIIPLIDAIKILTADDISPYIGNEKFIMWN